MTTPAERVVRLMAWKPDHPPSPGLLDGLEDERVAEVPAQVSEDIRDQVVQATLDELEQMGMVAVDEDGGYWVTAAGRAALKEPPADDVPGGPVWTVTLYRPGPGLPWVVDEITEVTGTGPGAVDLVCPAGAGGGI